MTTCADGADCDLPGIGCAQDDEIEQTGPKRALDLAIFAINTILYPDASSAEDCARLVAESESAIAQLAKLREWVIAQGEDLQL